MSEVEIAGQTYRIGRMNAVQQYEVTRRLGPVVALLSREIHEAAPGLDGARWVAGMATGALGELSQDNSDYIRRACLGFVERRTVTSPNPLWAKIMVGEQMMFDDIDLLTMLALMDAVLQENLETFFLKLRAVLSEPQPSPDPALSP